MVPILWTWAVLTSCPFCSAGSPDEDVLPLKVVVTGEDEDDAFLQPVQRLVQLDRQSRGEIDFATPSGKLIFEVVDGGVLVDREGKGTIDRKGDPVPDGEVVKVPVNLAGKTFGYPIAITPVRRGGRGKTTLAFIQARFHLEAASGATKVVLLDSDLNGRFGDRPDPAGGGKGDSIRIGAKGAFHPFTTHVEVGGAIRRIEVAGGGESLVLRPYTGPLSTLKVETASGWETSATLLRADGAFAVDATSGGEVRLLPGAYRIDACTASHKSKVRRSVFGRAIDKLRGGSGDDEEKKVDVILNGPGSGAKPVTVAEGANTWRMGPPFRLEFTARLSTEDEADAEITDVSLAGGGGDRYLVDNCSANRSATIRAFVRAGSRESQVSTLSYG